MSKRTEAFNLLGIAALWLTTAWFLPHLLAKVLPRVVLDSLSLPAFSMLCQSMTTLVGISAARASFSRPWKTIGLRRPRALHVGLAAMLAPMVFVAASIVAIKIAEPYLMDELAREGAGASRRNAGAFGKAVTEAPLLVTLVWGALLAAIAEELAFRGALFGAVQKGALALFEKSETPASTSLDGERSTSLARPDLISGVLAVVLTAAAFGAMHADMKGSVGIVRVASSSLLGLACGSARLATGTVLVPMVLHFFYNSVSVGLGRGIFRSDSDPLLSVIPNRLLGIAVLAGVLAVVFGIARLASRGDAP